MNSPEKMFQYFIKKSITGLHVKLSGAMEQMDIARFSHMLQSIHDQSERLFLDVRDLNINNDALRQSFKQCLTHIPPKQVFFKGEQGVSLGQQGNRVLFMKDSPCKCAGACKSCACDSRVKDRNARFTFKGGQAQAV